MKFVVGLGVAAIVGGVLGGIAPLTWATGAIFAIGCLTGSIFTLLADY